MKFSALLASLGFFCLAQLISTSSVDPEQALFAYTRCMEIYAEPLDTTDRRTALAQWTTWKMTDGKLYNTECYAQCTLERLGLLDPNTGNIEVDQIDEQFNKYGQIVGVNSDDKNNLKNAFSKINKNLKTCETVFTEYMKNVHGDADLLGIARKLYHGNNETTKLVYDRMAERGESIRVKYQSYFEYCENQYYKDDTDTLCKIRQYQTDVSDLEKFSQHTECIFKGLRYIDSDNKFNSSEIIRDFTLVNKPDFDDKIKQCTEKNSVLEVYKCFVEGDKDFVNAFKEAFDYREIRSRNYSYRLKKPEYNPEEIKQQVSAIDQGNSCDTL